jgi:hypothetical protein
MINLKIYYKNGEDVCSESIATTSVELCANGDCCAPCTGERTLDVSIAPNTCYEKTTVNGSIRYKFPLQINAKCSGVALSSQVFTSLKTYVDGREVIDGIKLENGTYYNYLSELNYLAACATGFQVVGVINECGTPSTYSSAVIPYCQVGPCVTDPCVTCTSTELSVALDTSELCFVPNETEGKEYAPLNPYVMCGTTAIYNADIEITIKQNTAGCNLELVRIGTQYYLKKDLGCQTAFSGIVELEFCINKC